MVRIGIKGNPTRLNTCQMVELNRKNSAILGRCRAVKPEARIGSAAKDPWRRRIQDKQTPLGIEGDTLWVGKIKLPGFKTSNGFSSRFQIANRFCLYLNQFFGSLIKKNQTIRLSIESHVQRV